MCRFFLQLFYHVLGRPFEFVTVNAILPVHKSCSLCCAVSFGARPVEISGALPLVTPWCAQTDRRNGAPPNIFATTRSIQWGGARVFVIDRAGQPVRSIHRETAVASWMPVRAKKGSPVKIRRGPATVSRKQPPVCATRRSRRGRSGDALKG